MGLNKAKTVAIIGGGVAGLAAGILLARRGMQVKLFEANHKLGGCCAATTQGGYTFSDGALWLVAPCLLDHAFQRIGLDRPTLLPLQKITAAVTMHLSNGAIVTIDDDRGPIVTLTRPNGMVDSIRPQQEFMQMLKRWEPITQPFTEDLLLHPFSYLRLLRKAWRYLSQLNEPIDAALKRFFTDKEMQVAIAGALNYTGVPLEKMQAIKLLDLTVTFSQGYQLPQGGIGQIPKVLGDAFEQQGGEIFFNAPVKKIIIKNRRVQGVELNEARVIEADVVFSTVSGMMTYLSLVAPQDVPSAMLKRIKKTPLSTTMLSIQLGLSNKIDVRSQFYYHLPITAASTGQSAEIFFYTVPTFTISELAPPGGSIVEIFPTISQDLAVDAWTSQRTKACSEAAIATLSQLHDINIVETRIRGPQDFQTGLHLYEGRVYGLSPAIKPNAYFPHQSPISGLYLAGQTTYPGYGINPAMMSGILAAEQLLKSQ